MTIKIPPLPELVAHIPFADQLRQVQREAALMALEEAAKAMIDLHAQQTINNQEFPKAWHEGVAAAYEAIRALRAELEAS